MVLFGVLLGLYFIISAPQEQPQAFAFDPKAKIATIPIEGMTCTSCAARVKRTLESIEGVTAIQVSLKDRHARIQYIDEME